MFAILPRKRLKVAILIFGQPRFIDNEYVSRRLMRWARHSEVTFFGHSWFSSPHDFPSSWSGLKKIQLPHDAETKIRIQYPNIELEMDYPKRFSLNEGVLSIEPIQADSASFDSQEAINVSNTLSMLYSINRVLSLFLNSSNPQQYDIVLLTRWDNYILYYPQPKNLPNLGLNLVNQWPGFPDVLLSGPLGEIQATDVLPVLSSVLEEFTDETPLVGENLKHYAFTIQSDSKKLNRIFGLMLVLRSHELIINDTITVISRYFFYIFKQKMFQVYNLIRRKTEF